MWNSDASRSLAAPDGVSHGRSANDGMVCGGVLCDAPKVLALHAPPGQYTHMRAFWFLASAVLALGLFSIGSAVVYRHDARLALGTGIVAVVAPLAWHVIRERGRAGPRRRRLTLRLGVAAVVLAGALMVVRGRVGFLHDLRANALWYLGFASPPMLVSMLRYVPDEAQSVTAIADDLGNTQDGDPPWEGTLTVIVGGGVRYVYQGAERQILDVVRNQGGVRIDARHATVTNRPAIALGDHVPAWLAPLVARVPVGAARFTAIREIASFPGKPSAVFWVDGKVLEGRLVGDAYALMAVKPRLEAYVHEQGGVALLFLLRAAVLELGPAVITVERGDVVLRVSR